MSQNQTAQDREYGLDLFRTISMLSVIMVHIIGHGGLGAAYDSGTAGNIIALFLQTAVYPAVNCFVLNSGYLLTGKSFRLSRLLQIWITAVFWSVVIQCAFFIADPSVISLGKILFMFLPVLNGRYWFLNAYIVMTLVSPFLNHLLNTLPRWKIRALLLVSAAVFCIVPVLALNNDVFSTQNGYSFPWFLILYLTGGYIKKYGSRPQKGYPFLIAYLMLCLFQLIWIAGIDLIAVDALLAYRNMFMKYTSVLIYGEAICLLLYFRSNRNPHPMFLSKMCGFLSPMVFSVYLIHDHPLIRAEFMSERFAGAAEYPLPLVFISVIVIALVVFMVCILLDCIRHYLFKLLKIPDLTNRCGDWITEKITALLMRE
ncbi:MAG: acyltransferase [Clostridia bacterium]|nr:acyltransferase [Clostridia bacterium]